VHWEVLLPLLHLTIFMLAALILVILTIVWRRADGPGRSKAQPRHRRAPSSTSSAFGLGFMLAEWA